jgi:8-oxo-dGTP pyrophosphatase MutT (NUDIX family)
VSEFRVVGATTRWQGTFLEVVDTTIAASDGATFERSVVRHPGAVVIVPVTADRRHAILVRQYRAAIDGDLLEVPAGKRDVDGEPPEETARRELEEEIGYRPGRLVPLCEFYNSPGFTDEYTYLYCALDLEQLPEARAVTAEEAAMTIEQVAFADLDRRIADREIVDAKSIIGLTLTRQHLERFDAGGGARTS